MVVRFTVFMGILLGALSWVLLVPLTPPNFQASPGGAIDQVREAGMVPKIGEMVMSEEIGHGVFEVPDTDAEHLAAVMAGGGMAGMEGMPIGEQAEQPMEGMPMGEQAEQPMEGMQMGEQAEQPMEGMQVDEQAEQPMEGMPMDEQAEQPTEGMQMGEQAEQPMEGMQMGGEAGHEGEAEEEGNEGGGGLMVMAADMAGMASRTVEIEMTEWGISNGSLTVKPGEVIQFVVRNSGNIPHEFMFMPAAAMQAVNYRLERADWNLLEHEAPFEQSIVLPGDSFEVVLRIEQPGTWMFMCMFPYHMQLGMMGMMMTEGMSMDGMKM